MAPKRRRAWLWVGLASGVVVAGLAWGGWQLWQLASPLYDLRAVAAEARGHVAEGDLSALTADLGRVRQLAARADAAADTPAVVFAAGLPWVGDDVTVARELAGVAADLAGATAGIDPLLERLSGAGTPDLRVAAEAIAAVEPLRGAATSSAERLGRLDLGGLTLPVGDDVVRLREALAAVGPALDTLSPYLNALAILSSPGEEHTWFVALQNLGESRPSGGMIGSWLVVRASDGQLKVLERGLNEELDTDRPVDYTGYLPEGYEQVWGKSLDNWRSFTLSPNFPDNARMLARTWNAHGKARADGVLALGQGSVRYLAAATGPVEVEGRTIAPVDLAEYLSVGVYQDFPDPVKKDAAVTGIVTQIFDRVSAGQFDLPGLFAAALEGPSADYLQLWSSDRAVQKRIVAAGVSGAFPDEPGPIVSVRLADAAANKLDSFMHLAAEYRLGECVVDDGGVATRRSTMTVTLRNAVPDGLTDYVTGKGDLLDGRRHPVGSSRDFVIVHLPVAATLTSALLNGEQALVQTAWVGERHMLVFDVALEPGESGIVELTWDEFPTDSEDRPFPLTPTIVLPPLANSAETRVADGTACR